MCSSDLISEERGNNYMKITNGMTNQMVLKEIGTRLQNYRLDMNMKQSELSKKSGVSVATIRRLESGEDVGLSKVVSILLAMGLSSNLDFIIPEEIVNPIDVSSLGHTRKRAMKKDKREDTIIWGE